MGDNSFKIPDQAANLRRLVETVVPKLPHKARRLAFLSGKGGVGKTSLAVNIALVLARMGKKTVFVDCDLGLANADILLGIQPRITLDGILANGGDVKKSLIEVPSGLFILPGSESTIPKKAVGGGRLQDILMELDNDAEIIIMDGGAGIDEGVQHIAMLADEIVIVTSPESAAAVNAYRLIKVVLGHKDPPAIRIVINRARNDSNAGRAAASLLGAVKQFLFTDPEYIGWVPKDAIVEQAARERRPFVERYPGSLPSRAVVSVANKLYMPPPGPPKAA
jgi:flagellar biosynthesis protein FlhG